MYLLKLMFQENSYSSHPGQSTLRTCLPRHCTSFHRYSVLKSTFPHVLPCTFVKASVPGGGLIFPY